MTYTATNLKHLPNTAMPFKYITSDPTILGGKPCIKGTRISVAFILELFASGADHQEILKAYPHLPPEGVEEALSYAAFAFRNEYILMAEIPEHASAGFSNTGR